jgi:hypothetical protein
VKVSEWCVEYCVLQESKRASKTVQRLFLFPQPIFLVLIDNNCFQVPLSRANWSTVLSWALPILLVDEILKAIGRRLNQKAGSNTQL